jgi:hypothetical protein
MLSAARWIAPWACALGLATILACSVDRALAPLADVPEVSAADRAEPWASRARQDCEHGTTYVGMGSWMCLPRD